MLEPLILSDGILQVARTWCDQLKSQWECPGPEPIVIGETVLRSPVDNSERRVVLWLVSSIPPGVKGKARPGVMCPLTEELSEGYTLAINRSMISSDKDLMRTVLHEITHAVDPYFDSDSLMQNPSNGPKVFLDAYQEFRLPSEQRAFSAMFTEDLRLSLLNGTFRNPGVSALYFRDQSPEFAGFWHGTNDGTRQQTIEHFRQIVDHLKRPSL